MGESGIELVGPVDTAAVGHHHHLFATGTKDLHDLVDILTEFLRIEVRLHTQK
jgi:hypothetical protein